MFTWTETEPPTMKAGMNNGKADRKKDDHKQDDHKEKGDYPAEKRVIQ